MSKVGIKLKKAETRASIIRKPRIASQEEERQRVIELDIRKPYFKLYTNIFYSLASIQSHVIGEVARNMEYIRQGYTYNDKLIFGKICEHIEEIKKLNDALVMPFWDTMDKAILKQLRIDSNDLTRLVLLACDRCQHDVEKWNRLEEWVKMMPAGGMISDEIVETFRLR